MTDRKFKIQIIGGVEGMVYSDSDLELSLERTYCNGNRFYCSNTSGGGYGASAIAFIKRIEIIDNLCEYFNTRKAPGIFVLDEADKDRKELEHLFTNLVSKGQKITVEYGSSTKR